MKHVWTVLCSKSITDSEENSISLMDCVENIFIKTGSDELNEMRGKIKKIPVNLELTSLWFDEGIKKKREFEVLIKFFNNNKELEKINANFVFAENISRMRTRMKISMLPITDSGLYFFKISFRSKNQKIFYDVAEIPLNIKIN